MIPALKAGHLYLKKDCPSVDDFCSDTINMNTVLVKFKLSLLVDSHVSTRNPKRNSLQEKSAGQAQEG